MTRKRYCKLIQSLGHGRNVANMIAATDRRYGHPYAGQWEVVQLCHKASPRAGICTNAVTAPSGIVHVRRKARRAA